VASIYQSIEILSKEKGIDPQIVLDAVKDAMLVAARKHFRTTEDLIAELDQSSGQILVYGIRNVVESVQDPGKEMALPEARELDPNIEVGGQIKIAKPTDVLGRISAQTAKQVILQKVREAERETVHSEYSGRVGELVNCTVKRIEGQDLMVDIGKTEARLPKKEQSRLESFSVGERVRCVIKMVEKAGKNAGVIVSRAAPELVMRLFEQEVPEIYDNTVVIKGCAREAGERTKIAVSSRDRDVDSVGACVGMKGMRVQSIIRELRGEKIDIIEYSEDPIVFATHALSPAKIAKVTVLDVGGKHMEVVVDDTQLSLAIGKKGQNVRLAAKLLGWRIDIKSEEEKRQEVESQMAALSQPGTPVSALIEYGLQERIAGKLVEAGIGTIEQLGSMTPEDLAAIPGTTPDLIEELQTVVAGYYAAFEQAAAESAGQLEGAFVSEGQEPGGEYDATESVEAAVEANPEVAEPSPEELNEIAEGELIPAGQAEDPAISGLSHASSSLKDAPSANNTVEDEEFDTIKDTDRQA
jgi:transcription termination/antitermination protein NusA